MSVYEQYPQLMEDLREGKQEAFKVVFQRLNHILVYTARERLMRNPDAIEDIVSECWLKLFRHRAKFKCLEHVEATGVDIVKKLCIDRWRMRSTKERFISGYITDCEILEDPSVNNESIYDKECQILSSAIDKLHPRRKEVFKAYFFNREDTPTIAERLRLSPQTVLNSKAKAIKVLKKICRKEYELLSV